MEVDSPALRRVLAATGIDHLVEVLSDRLAGSDLTTLLLAVMQRHTAATTAPEVLARDGTDRFTVTSLRDGRRVQAATSQVVGSLPDRAAGRSYSTTTCVKLDVRVGDDWQEVGDGGFRGLDRPPAVRPQGAPADRCAQSRAARRRHRHDAGPTMTTGAGAGGN